MSGNGKTCVAWVVAVAVGMGLLCGPRSASAEEKEISVDDLPAAVAEAVRALYPDGTVEEAVQDTEDGQVVYELEVASGGKVYDVELTADGKVLKVEEEGDEDEDDEDEEDDDEEDDDEEDDDDDEDDDDEDDE